MNPFAWSKDDSGGWNADNLKCIPDTGLPVTRFPLIARSRSHCHEHPAGRP